MCRVDDIQHAITWVSNEVEPAKMRFRQMTVTASKEVAAAIDQANNSCNLAFGRLLAGQGNGAHGTMALCWHVGMHMSQKQHASDRCRN